MHHALSVAELADRLAPLLSPDTRPLAVAVSGGPDSVALFHLMDTWTRRIGVPLVALTVDHGLRSDSAAEAAAVGHLAAARGREHRILAWRGTKPVTGLSEAAREARYRLLGDACRAGGIETLVLAHHLDDQAETVLYRIERDTGPDGLAGMGRVVERDGVRLLRPLLDVPKARLIATCQIAGLVFVDDPTNRDQHYVRPRLRALMPRLDAAGVTAERLGRLADAMGTARAHLDMAVRDWVAVHAEVMAAGWIGFEVTALDTIPKPLCGRVIERLLRWVGGGGYPPRGDRLDRLIGWLTRTTDDGARTLAGCCVGRTGARVVIFREWQAAAPPLLVPPGHTRVWDGRYSIRNEGTAPVRVEACGSEGWRRWRRSIGASGLGTREGMLIPHPARLALPMVVDLDGGIALPHLTEQAANATAWIGDRVRVRFRSMDVFQDARSGGCSRIPAPFPPSNRRLAT
ncbi:MAG: tRNA lysidine(34) synthetase TilS [Alphaproteobacteria bacterium]|nr:tRNA lysidine(34) synthetase TilS [Alphaproteobacteria bacterium]